MGEPKPISRFHGVMVTGVILALSGVFIATADTRFVKRGVSRRQADGASWKTAFGTIQEAIDAAYQGGGGEVWVAAGTYEEPRSCLEDGVETGSLLLRPGVSLFGGFSGNETDLLARDVLHNPTTISGARARGGLPALHVVVGAADSKLDGFFISGGDANGSTESQQRGAGLLCLDVPMSIANCTFRDNVATRTGGGVFVRGSTIRFDTCVFVGNHVKDRSKTKDKDGSGGGLALIRMNNAHIEDCLFSENDAFRRGGGCFALSSKVSVYQCTFIYNSSNLGGGVALYENSAGSFSKCRFEQNKASYAGAIRLAMGSEAQVRDSIIQQNQATGAGGAFALMIRCKMAMSGGLMAANVATRDCGGAVLLEYSALNAIDVEFRDNSSAHGGVAGLEKSEIKLLRCTLVGNKPNALLYRTAGEKSGFDQCIVDESAGPIMICTSANQTVGTLKEMESLHPEWKNNREFSPSNAPASP